MFELKPLSLDAIPRALERADRYRLLNEPAEAESICLDILAADPNNQRALVMLILALTDQFGQSRPSLGGDRCETYVARLDDEYERVYYTGLIHERRAKRAYGGRMDTSAMYEWLREAMTWYEKAAAIRPAGNDDAVLRWNTCARILTHNPDLRQMEEEQRVEYLE